MKQTMIAQFVPRVSVGGDYESQVRVTDGCGNELVVPWSGTGCDDAAVVEFCRRMGWSGTLQVSVFGASRVYVWEHSSWSMTIENEMITRVAQAVEVIESARLLWEGASWTHERTDSAGVRLMDGTGIPLYCDGSGRACGYCASVQADANEADDLAVSAVRSLQSGSVSDALESIERAEALEAKWGDAPAYRPAAEAVRALLRSDGGGK